MKDNNIFWINDPLLLIDKDIWPESSMSYYEKLNTTSRLIIITTIILYSLTMKINILFVGFITLVCVILMYFLRKKKKEGFVEKIGGIGNDLTSILEKEFHPVTKENPYGNVLVNEIMDNPKRKPAPPAFNNEVHNKIVEATKDMVQDNNPGINVRKDVFGDTAQKYTLDRASLPFHTMPSTQIPNSQGAFAQYLYGNIGTCKQQNNFNCNS